MADNVEEVVRRAQSRVGAVISDKWTIERLLGIGGMGAVYAARHRNKKKAAIKMLHPELSVDPTLRERFLREGYVANSVEHPGSVKVDDDGVAEDGSVYLVVELLEGENLDARWTRKGRKLPVREVLWIAEHLLDVLVVAHAAGIVHRDLKPENIFLTKDRQLKVLDFGIARLRERGESSTATKTGSFMGTPVFMAPEQARGRWESVDQRTDLWAVGATMYTLLTGRYVHQAETVNETLGLAMSQPAAPISQLLPELSEPVAKLIDKSLAYHMDYRFESAKSMQEAVRQAFQSMGAAPEPRVSVPDAAEAATTLASARDEHSEPTPSPVQVKAVKGPGATAAAVSVTSPDSKPKKKRAALGLATLGLLLLVAIAIGVWRSQSTPTVTDTAESVQARQPDQATPVAASGPARPIVEVADRAAVSVDDLPVAQDEKKPAAAVNKADKAKVQPQAKPSAAPAQAPAPAPASPKPVGDPFSVRR